MDTLCVFVSVPAPSDPALTFVMTLWPSWQPGQSTSLKASLADYNCLAFVDAQTKGTIINTGAVVADGIKQAAIAWASANGSKGLTTSQVFVFGAPS